MLDYKQLYDHTQLWPFKKNAYYSQPNRQTHKQSWDPFTYDCSIEITIWWQFYLVSSNCCRSLVCSSSQLAPRIGLYTASLVSLTDVLIGWCASDCDAPTHIVTYPNKHGEYPPSPTWRASPTWRKQKAFPLPVEKAGNSLLFSEAADSPMLADMGRETVYQKLELRNLTPDTTDVLSWQQLNIGRIWHGI